MTTQQSLTSLSRETNSLLRTLLLSIVEKAPLITSRIAAKDQAYASRLAQDPPPSLIVTTTSGNFTLSPDSLDSREAAADALAKDWHKGIETSHVWWRGKGGSMWENESGGASDDPLA